MGDYACEELGLHVHACERRLMHVMEDGHISRENRFTCVMTVVHQLTHHLFMAHLASFPTNIQHGVVS